MKNVVRPFSPQSRDTENWSALIEGLFAHSDLTAEEMTLKAKPPKPLHKPDDIALVADVIEALKDVEQARFARPALRHALKEIAKATLSRPTKNPLRR